MLLRNCKNLIYVSINVQCLQWETRQIRIIKAGTLEHILKYTLFLTPNQQKEDFKNCNQNVLEEERNNVAHAMHVLFCTYRQYHLPQQVFDIILKNMHNCCQRQMTFILHYWLDNYSEDFTTEYISDSNDKNSVIDVSRDSNSLTNSGFESNSSNYDSNLSSNSSDSEHKPITLADKLLTLPNIDDKIYRKCLNIVDMKTESVQDVIPTNQVIIYLFFAYLTQKYKLIPI